MFDSTVSPEELEIERLARAARLGRGLRTAARRALRLARRYRDDEGPGGAREAACVKQALEWRASAHALKNAPHESPAGSERPGLARTTAPARKTDRRAG